jgi:hypothetical protein
LTVAVYKANKSAGIGSNLYTDAAVSINSTTLADKTFTINGTGLAAGDWLDIRMAVAVNDAATGTAVTGIVGDVALRLDIKG